MYPIHKHCQTLGSNRNSRFVAYLNRARRFVEVSYTSDTLRPFGFDVADYTGHLENLKGLSHWMGAWMHKKKCVWIRGWSLIVVGSLSSCWPLGVRIWIWVEIIPLYGHSLYTDGLAIFYYLEISGETFDFEFWCAMLMDVYNVSDLLNTLTQVSHYALSEFGIWNLE